MWRAFDETGRLAYPDFVETVAAVIPMYHVRVLGGAMYLAGAVLLGVNFVMTWRSRPRVYEEPVQEAPALAAGYEDPPPPPPLAPDQQHRPGPQGRRLPPGRLAPALGAAPAPVHRLDDRRGQHRRACRGRPAVRGAEQRADDRERRAVHAPRARRPRHLHRRG